MKCYLHQTVDAVGICSECGQGVCDSCAVKISGRVYCKQDADKVFGRRKRPQGEKIERGMANTVNALMFGIYGAFGMALGAAFILGSFILGGIALIPSAGELGLASLGFWGLGGIIIIMGALGIVTAAWLWGGKFSGIGVGTSLLIAGVIIDILIMVLGRNILSYEVGMTFFAINTIMLILIAWGWRAINQITDFDGEAPVL